MFDANGILIDKLIPIDEIALRLDNPMVQALRAGEKDFPVLNILFPFKGTMTNIVKQFDDVAPAPLLLSRKMLMNCFSITLSGLLTIRLR